MTIGVIKMKYLFGPVNSRRLGLSLGIDLIPFKTCSFNCLYCECGKTTNITTNIDSYVPVDQVITELEETLSKKPELDVITFAGSGEPTLHNGIQKIIQFLKDNYPQYKVSVLTNGSLLHIQSVRESILKSDIIIPSLDAVSEQVFKKITRPAKGLTAAKLVEGLVALRKDYKNKIILEIFIIPGLNDNENELGLLKSACINISPDIIQLNTLDRPGTEKWVQPATNEKLLEIQSFFRPLPVEIINKPKNKNQEPNTGMRNLSDELVSTISRRPSTLEDLTSSLGMSQKDILKVLHFLLSKGIIKEESSPSDRGTFYRLKI